MKATKVIITIVGLAIIAFLGYFFYNSVMTLENENVNYEFTAGEEIDNSYEEEPAPELELEFESEEELESEIELQESQEEQAEQDFNDLENLDF